MKPRERKILLIHVDYSVQYYLISTSFRLLCRTPVQANEQINVCYHARPINVQVIPFTILNDSIFEIRFSQEGRRWRKVTKIIRQPEGWLQTLYGRDLNSSNRLDLYIGVYMI